MLSYHTPVMPEEVINFLHVDFGNWYVDCNLGGGGHSELILKAGGKVLGIDLDPEAIYEVASKHHLPITSKDGKLNAKSQNLILCQGNFNQMQKIVDDQKIGRVRGVLFDLGVSTHQLESAQRGFSFNTEASLDMRMDQTSKQAKASNLINGLNQTELQELFWKLGEERFARSIARKIIEERQKTPILTTNRLAKIITSAHKRSFTDRTHPATRVFQALRIAVNDELNSLREALPQALNILKPEGRLVILTFHSLEDRIVKNFFKAEEQDKKIKILTAKPIRPNTLEINQNPRSRSGKLRACQKLG